MDHDESYVLSGGAESDKSFSGEGYFADSIRMSYQRARDGSLSSKFWCPTQLACP